MGAPPLNATLCSLQGQTMIEQTEVIPTELIASRDRDAATHDLNRHVWLLRITGAVLLVCGWLLVSLPAFGSVYFVVDTVVLGALAAYAFLAARHGRRISVNLEKKLRLSLLVHNVE